MNGSSVSRTVYLPLKRYKAKLCQKRATHSFFIFNPIPGSGGVYKNPHPTKNKPKEPKIASLVIDRGLSYNKVKLQSFGWSPLILISNIKIYNRI